MSAKMGLPETERKSTGLAICASVAMNCQWYNSKIYILSLEANWIKLCGALRIISLGISSKFLHTHTQSQINVSNLISLNLMKFTASEINLLCNEIIRIIMKMTCSLNIVHFMWEAFSCRGSRAYRLVIIIVDDVSFIIRHTKNQTALKSNLRWMNFKR